VKLVDLLPEERVIVPLAADDLDDAAVVLARTMTLTDSAQGELEALVRERAATGLVTAGQAFFVHARSADVAGVQVALGVSPVPLPRSEGAEQAARIVVLIVAPPRESSARLRAVGAFGVVLGREEVVRVLLDAESAAAILAAPPWADMELPGYLTVRDVMVPQGVALRPAATLGEAANLMVSRDLSALPVVSDTNEVLGVVTHRDLLSHLLPLYVKRLNTPDGDHPARQRGLDPHDIPVRDVMDRSVLCVSEDQTLGEVATMMLNRNVDRFPVVRDGALVGFLTRGDIVRRLLGP
jgi:CBS domain-containing protein